MRKNFEMVEFWKADRQILRRARFIYDPSLTLDQLRPVIKTDKEETKASTVETGLLFKDLQH
jgi:hypothetical protein